MRMTASRKFAASLTLLLVTQSVALARDREEKIPAKPATSTLYRTTSTTRNFYEVLSDLMGDFEYDLKNGQVTGLRDLAIRNIAMSENIPPSFKNHIELVVTEKIITTTKSRVVQCLACRARTTTLNNDQMVISANDVNANELSRIAKSSGIQNFMDVAFSYQPNGMVMSLYTVDAETGSVVWSRSYNSETSRASAYRRGVDFSQIDEARRSNEYIPLIQYRVSLGYYNEPDLTSRASCIGLGFRMVERYDNRKKEVGFEMDYLKDTSSISGAPATPAAGTKGAGVFGGFNLTLLFVHAWNLIGSEENYNSVRGTIFGAVGGTYTSGFLGGLVRGGYEWRLAKHWAVNTSLGYRPQATKLLNGTTATVSGVEFGFGVSALF